MVPRIDGTAGDVEENASMIMPKQHEQRRKLAGESINPCCKRGGSSFARMSTHAMRLNNETARWVLDYME